MLKRSVINQTIQDAEDAFSAHGWYLPPNPKWDLTDFGLGEFNHFGLTLVNLAEEPEYCEKLMFAYEAQKTPAHTHARKKEDIICRYGQLCLRLWPGKPDASAGGTVEVPVNGEPITIKAGEVLTLESGSRVTLVPGVYHEFWSASSYCIIGEVSTANDDLNDNFFANPEIGRFPGIEEDEPAIVKLISD